MQSQMMYAGERSSAAREMAMEMMAADQRQMGSCSPLGRFMSRVFTCRGNKGRMRSERMDYYGATAYPAAQTCYVSPAAPARAVAFATATANANAHAMRPEPMQAHAVAMPMAGATYGAASPRGGGKRKKKKSKNKHVRFAPAGAEPVPTDAPPPHAAHYAPPAAAAASGGGQLHHQHYPSASAGAEPYSTAASAAHGNGRYAYAPSPLARWEMLGSAAAGTPRRHEYFSGEYRWYYPTPVREGIYSLATDANRLTTIFSEENPNACAIV
uniref:Uncharacterized protein n=1 Tax=Oryza punctata TaxID=4537 RepID=A0A0E0LB64_ORYPU